MDGMADYQIRALARRLAALEARAKQSKQPTLAFSTIDGGGALQATDENDALTMIVGKQFDDTNTAAVVTGPTPPTPSAPLVTPAPGVLRAYWDGTFEDNGFAPMDFSRVMVYAEPMSTYVGPQPLNQALMVGEFNTATGSEVTISLPGVEHAFYLVCWTQAGKYGAASDPSLGTPALINKGEIADGAVGSSKIADDAVRDNHVPTDEIRPQGMSVNPVGGVFSNLIHDAGFYDPFFRTQRLADAKSLGATAPVGMASFVQVNNLAPANIERPSALTGWTAGPHTSLKIAPPIASDKRRLETIVVDIIGSGIATGEVIVSATIDHTFKASRSYQVEASWLDRFPSAVYHGELRAEWLDAASTVLATSYITGADSRIDTNPFDGSLTTPATAPSKLRLSWLFYDKDGSTATLPAQANWLSVGLGNSGDSVILIEQGPEIDKDSWLLEVDETLTEYPGANLVTNSGADTDTSGWTQGSNTTLSRSTAQAFTGPASFALTSSAAGEVSMMSPHLAAGMDWQAFRYYHRGSASGMTTKIAMNYYNSSGTLLRREVRSAEEVSNSSWVRTRSAYQIDELVSTVRIEIIGVATEASQTLYVDLVSVHDISTANSFEMPLSSRNIPCVPGQVISSMWHWQTELLNSPAPLVAPRFYDEDGNALGGGSSFGDTLYTPSLATYPGWVVLTFSETAPVGAVSFMPHLLIGHQFSTVQRVRNLTVLIGGVADQGSQNTSVLTPTLLEFSAGRPETGEKIDMFKVNLEPDAQEAYISSKGTVDHRGHFRVSELETGGQALFVSEIGETTIRSLSITSVATASALKETADTGWLPLTLGGTWVNFDASRTPQYRRHHGRVYYRGFIKDGSVAPGSTFGSVPTGFRPDSRTAHDHYSPVVSADAVGVIAINASTGELQVISGISSVWMDLSAISYFAAGY